MSLSVSSIENVSSGAVVNEDNPVVYHLSNTGTTQHMLVEYTLSTDPSTKLYAEVNNGSGTISVQVNDATHTIPTVTLTGVAYATTDGTTHGAAIDDFHIAGTTAGQYNLASTLATPSVSDDHLHISLQPLSTSESENYVVQADFGSGFNFLGHSPSDFYVQIKGEDGSVQYVQIGSTLEQSGGNISFATNEIYLRSSAPTSEYSDSNQNGGDGNNQNSENGINGGGSSQSEAGNNGSDSTQYTYTAFNTSDVVDDYSFTVVKYNSDSGEESHTTEFNSWGDLHKVDANSESSDHQFGVQLDTFDNAKGDQVDLSHLLDGNSHITDSIYIGSGMTSHSDLTITESGQNGGSFNAVTAYNHELTTQDLLGNSQLNNSGATWIDSININSAHAGTQVSDIHAATSLSGDSWVYSIQNGHVDTTHSSGNTLTIVPDGSGQTPVVEIKTADGTVHTLDHVNTIVWHG